MSSDLFLIEVAAWTVSLVPSVTVPEIGGIVKFLNFKPFEFFRQASSSEMNGKNAQLNSLRLTGITFECSSFRMTVLLLAIPLYVVIAQWSQEDEKMEHGQKLIGVAHVSLVKLSPKELHENEEVRHSEIRTISGLFPVRDLLGKAVGQIHMRIQLIEMNCSVTADSSAEQLTQEPTVCHFTSSQSRPACVSKSVRERPQVKSHNGVAISIPVHRDQTVAKMVSRECEAKGDPLVSPQGASESTASFYSRQDALTSCPTADTRAACQTTGRSVECPEPQFVHHTTTVHVPASSLGSREDLKHVVRPPIHNESGEQSEHMFANYVHPRRSPVTPSSVNTPSRSKVDSQSPLSENELPILKSLLRELQSLRSRKDHKKRSWGSELDVVYSLLSATCSSFQAKPRSDHGSFPIGRHQVCERNLSESRNRTPQLRVASANERQQRISQMSMPIRRPPPPGRSVPKDRGWLRSTPVYKGSQKCILMPRQNHAQMLRLQQLRLKEQKKVRSLSHAEARPKSVAILRQKKSKSKQSGSQSEQSNMMDSTPSRQERHRDKHRQSCSPPSKSRFARPLVGRTSPMMTPTISLGNVEPEPPKPAEQSRTTTCVSLAISARSTPHVPSHNRRRNSGCRLLKSELSDKSESMEDSRGVQVTAGAKGEDFSAMRPRHSSSSPKVKYVALTRVLSRPVHEELDKIDSVSGTSPLSCDNSLTEEVPGVSRSKHSHLDCSKNAICLLHDSEPDRTEQARSESRASQIVPLMYISQSPNTLSLISEPRKLNTSETGVTEVARIEEEVGVGRLSEITDGAEYPKSISSASSPVAARLESEEHTDMGRICHQSKALSLTNPVCYSDKVSSVGGIHRGSTSFDATSFTRVTAQLGRRATTLPTDDGSIEVAPSHSEREQLNACANNKKRTQLPELEFPTMISEQATECADDMIEVMRSRGSHDYIIGGTMM
ncbi:hypothetical protein FGIG_05356 [Fasciola gigantica]|uniref:Uncharacterized protein n=1 Tax=Fasciola gigantica TaxID=46835 RepID=A0A504YF34_FASGI|nr:hypothetical protein FGIG_05356 [Fasciola gigantica]